MGQDAETNVAIVLSRMTRAMSEMKDTDQEAMLDWMDTMTPAQTKAVMRSLVT